MSLTVFGEEGVDLTDNSTTVEDLKNAVRSFVKEREWEKFHTLRNLAESISIESAELLEVFQWTTEDEGSHAGNDQVRLRLESELADILVYCVSLANAAGIDISKAFFDKMRRNEQRYPVEKFRGVYVKPGGAET